MALVVQAGASALAINTHGQSPLLESAFLGHCEIVSDLVAFGAEVLYMLRLKQRCFI